MLVMRYAMRLITLSDEQLSRSDVNGDGVVNTTDALLIMRIALNA